MSTDYPVELIREIEFADYRFDFEREVLTRSSGVIELPPKPSKILALLLRQPGELVTREEIIAKVWPDQVVDFDQNINFCIKQIREKLNDNSRSPEFIETVPKRGYRFLAETKVISKNFVAPFTKKWAIAVSCALLLLLPWIGYLSLKTEQPSDELSQGVKRGLYLLDEGGEKNRQLSLALFEKLIQEHPEFGDAYAGLVLAKLYNSPSGEQRNHVKNYLQLADKYAAESALTYLAKAKVAFYYDWNTALAYEYFKVANQKQPKTVMILHDLAVVAAIHGEMKESEEAIEMILSVDPGRFQEHYHAGWFYQVAGKYDLALKQCSESLEIVPDHFYSLLCAGRAAFKLQLLQTSAHYFTQLLAANETAPKLIDEIIQDINNGKIDSFNAWYVALLERFQADPFSLALAYGEHGEIDKALKALADAVKTRNIMIPTALAFSELAEVRKDKRFTDLMRNVIR